MTARSTGFTPSHVAAWSSVLLGFGLVQGVIYLRSYWGRFGLDPFQFSTASDLAFVGLTGIGVTVGFMCISAMLGGYVAKLVIDHAPRMKWLVVVLAVITVAGMVALVVSVDFGIYLVGGMILAWGILWLLHKSPDVPFEIKQLKLLPYMALAVAYIPLASHYFGQRKADHIAKAPATWQFQANGTTIPALDSGSYRFVGRLGGDYVFYEPHRVVVTIVPSDANPSISLVKGPKAKAAQ